MGRVDDSLKPGVTPIRLITPEGNYDRSMFGTAPFIYNNEGNWEPFEFTPNFVNGVFTLLFMNGCPVVMRPWTTYPEVQGEVEKFPEYYGKETMALSLNADQVTALVDTTQTKLLPREQVVGKTATARVAIQGYLTLTKIIIRIDGLYDGVHPTMELSAWSNSGVLSGPLNVMSLDGGGLDWSLPVIMRQEDYTQQMRDDGDTLVYTVGPITQRYQIAGLFEQVDMNPIVP